MSDEKIASQITAANDMRECRGTAGGPAPFSHLPVMPDECIEGLNINPSGVYADLTAGGGGHSELIAKKLDNGRLISIDRDIEAILACRQRLSPYGERVTVVEGNFSRVDEILSSVGAEQIDGFMIDLGVSSHQIDTPSRGFSYMADGPLDMRMSQNDKKSAYDVVNGYDREALVRILYEYGEEKFARRIAEQIIKAREVSPIRTTGELSDIIKGAVPKGSVPRGSHPAKRSFQAIRIEVNGELDAIEPALRSACGRLRSGGRAVILTFHSLEDRIVKRVFADMFRDCICPPDFPVCVCGHRATMKPITKKPVTAGEDEILNNSRSKSAKLRIAEKI